MSDDFDNPYAYTSEVPLESPMKVGWDPLADRSTRLGAVLIDGFLETIILLPLMFAVGAMTRAVQDPQSLTARIVISLGGMLIYVLLNGYLLYTRGQTIGKLLTRIQIVDFENGRLLPFLRVYVYRELWIEPIRFLGFLFSGPVGDPLVSMAGLIDVLLIFHANQRCLHDRFAGSKVVWYRSERERVD